MVPALRIHAICVPLLGLLAVGPCLAAELRVAPDGAPYSTIQAAAEAAEPGDVIVVEPGLYREEVRLEGSAPEGLTLRADGPPGSVVITGADVLTEWLPAPEVGENVFRHAPWDHVWVGWSEDMSHGAPPPVGRCEQVIWNGSLLTQVLELRQLEPGAFLADPKVEHALYVCLPDGADPRDGSVEVSLRSAPLSVSGRSVTVDGVLVRYAANMAQHGAIHIEGADHLVRNTIVEWTNGNGLSSRGDRITLDSVISRYNGQIGMGVGGEDCLLVDCSLLHNNRKGFPTGWEGGGIKITHALRVDVRGMLALGNVGTGIWYDIDNRECEIAHCLVLGNSDSGIFVEISGRGGFEVHHNVCVGNGTGDNWAAGGICLGESTDCDVHHNLCIANPTGISIREQGPREFDGRDGEIVSYRNERHSIHHNLLVGNTRAQFGLWWDNVHFGPHPSPDVGAAGTALDPLGAGLQVHDNLYAPLGDAPIIGWGVGWRDKSRTYGDLAPFRADTGLGERDQVVDTAHLRDALQSLGLADLEMPARLALAERGLLGPPGPAASTDHE